MDLLLIFLFGMNMLFVRKIEYSVKKYCIFNIYGILSGTCLIYTDTECFVMYICWYYFIIFACKTMFFVYWYFRLCRYFGNQLAKGHGQASSWPDHVQEATRNCHRTALRERRWQVRHLWLVCSPMYAGTSMWWMQLWFIPGQVCHLWWCWNIGCLLL